MKSVREIFETMEYGPAPDDTETALEWLDSHRRRFSPFINGEFPRFIDECYFDSLDPAGGQTLARIVQCGDMEVNAAVEAANAAFPRWSALSGYQRAGYLRGAASEIRKHAHLFATLESLTTGNPISNEREADLALVERHLRYHAGWAHLRFETFIGYDPIGTCGQVTPSALPLLMLAWKIAPALAAGNTLVIKPGQTASLTALLFAEVLQQIQLPPGVVNILTGDVSTDELLFKHRDIQKIFFTGPIETGRQIRSHTAGSGKHLSLSPSNRSPFIVFDDADLDSAVESFADSLWSDYGKISGAGSRLLCQENIYEKALENLHHRMEKLQIGIPGRVFEASSFRRPAEAIELANDSAYGLTASLWTENLSLALEIAPRLKAGTIWINSSNLFDAASGFGGYQESGLGREGGNEGMYEYLVPNWERSLGSFGRQDLDIHVRPVASSARNPAGEALGSRHAEQYIGGKFLAPVSGCCFAVRDAAGQFFTEAGFGNRKDIRNAVDAARSAPEWSTVGANERAQTLCRIAENLLLRANEFSRCIETLTGAQESEAKWETEKAVERLFYYASWADKYDGHIHQTACKSITLAVPEPWGIMGLICPAEHPLLWLVTLLAPALAAGNRVVAVPSTRFPIPAMDFCQVIATSDVPPGVINIVTGHSDDLAKALAQHEDVGAVWYVGSTKGSAAVERESRGNLKSTWVNHGRRRSLFEDYQAQGWEYLRHAVQVKNIWLPYG